MSWTDHLFPIIDCDAPVEGFPAEIAVSTAWHLDENGFSVPGAVRAFFGVSFSIFDSRGSLTRYFVIERLR